MGRLFKGGGGPGAEPPGQPPPQALTREAGGQVDEYGQKEQYGGNGKGGGEVRALLGVDVEGNCKGRAGGLHEALNGGKVLHGCGETGGVHQDRRFAYNTACGEDTAGNDAVYGGGEDNGADHAPLARA